MRKAIVHEPGKPAPVLPRTHPRKQTMRGWTGWPLASVIFVALGAYCYFRFQVTADITYFLPATEDKTLAYLSRGMANSSQTRTNIINLGGAAPDVLRDAAEQLSQAIRKCAEVASVTRGSDPQSQKQIYDLYFPRRYLFFSDRPDHLAKGELSDAGLTQAAFELRRGLASPAGMLVRKIAVTDPLLAFTKHLDRMQSTQAGSLLLVGDQFYTADSKYAVVFITSRNPAFDTVAQKQLLNAVYGAFEGINRRHGGRLTMEMSGVNRFAIASETSIQDDIERISIVETVAILAIYLAILGSLRNVLLLFAPLILGMLPALAAVLLIYGRVHGLTLAFGATMAGVCIDYPVHFLNHAMLDAERSTPIETLRRIWPALLMGALTTVLGTAALIWTSFPGIREIAIFSIINVMSALTITCWLIPRSLPENPRSTWLQRRLARWLGVGLSKLRRHRLRLIILPVAAAIVMVAGLTRLQWVDDLQKLSVNPDKLVAEDRAVRERISSVDMSRFVISLGKTEEEALELNDQVFFVLERARKAKEIRDFSSLHGLIWSRSLQLRSQEAVRNAPELSSRVLTALQSADFYPSMFKDFTTSLNADVAPLSLTQLLASPLGSVARGFVIRAGDRVGVITLLRGVDNPEALGRRLKGLQNVSFFDQKQFVQQMYSRYRQQVVQLVIFGLILISIILLVRYKGIGPMLASLIPAILAGGCAIAILAICGVKLNLLHVMALLLVLSMSVDFGVFLVESARGEGHLDPALLSILVASLTTALSFGLLAMSAQPALAAIGQVVALGMVLSLVLAPIALILLALGEDK